MTGFCTSMICGISSMKVQGEVLKEFVVIVHGRRQRPHLIKTKRRKDTAKDKKVRGMQRERLYG